MLDSASDVEAFAAVGTLALALLGFAAAKVVGVNCPVCRRFRAGERKSVQFLRAGQAQDGRLKTERYDVNEETWACRYCHQVWEKQTRTTL